MVPPLASQSSLSQKKGDQPGAEDDESKVACGKCKEVDCTVTIGQGKTKTHRTNWIRCDICVIWYHGMCQDLQNADVNNIKKLERYGVRWYCDQCITGADNGACSAGSSADNAPTLLHKTTMTKLDEIEKSIKTMQQTYAAALKSSNDQISRLTDLGSENSRQLAESKQQMKIAAESNEIAEKLIRRQQQINESESRKLNAILYGIPENETTQVMDHVSNCMKHECFKKLNPPVVAIRLGRKNKEEVGTKSFEAKTHPPRPIKLIFENESTKWEFVKRVNSGEMKQKKIFCKIDASQEVRNQEWALREQIREYRKADDGSQYRIRSLRIEQKQPSGEWQVLKPVRNTKETNF